MKKILLLSLIALTLFSCNKDDEDPNAEKNIELNNVSLSGVWYPKSIIKSNGNIVPYVGICTTKRDSVHINQQTDISYTRNVNNCVAAQDNCTGAALGGNTIYSCSWCFNGTITQFTNKTLRIEYGEVRDNYYGNDFYDCTGIILTRE